MKKLLCLALSFMLVFTMSVSPIFAAETEDNHTYHGYIGDKDQIQYWLDMETDTLTMGKGIGTDPLPNEFNYSEAFIEEKLDLQFNHIRIIELKDDFDAPIEKGLYDYIQEIQTLQKVSAAKENIMYSSDESGALFDKDKTKLYNYPRQNPQTEYTIPSTVIQLGVVDSKNPERQMLSFPFRGAENLKTINIISEITNLKGSFFSACSNLEAINVNSENAAYTSDNGVVYTKSMDKLVSYPINKTGDSYKIPSSVTTVGDSAFIGNQNLKKVELPTSLTTIEYRGFYGMHSLEGEFIIPSTVTSIGDEAFAWCKNLTAIKLCEGSQLTEIPMYCFHGGTQLRSGDFGNGASMTDAAFDESYFSFLNLPAGSKVTSFSNNAEAFLDVTGNSFDLSNYFSYVDAEKLTIVENGSKDGTVIKIIDVNKPIKYTYDTGGIYNTGDEKNGKSVIIEGKINTNVNVPISEENFPDAAFRTEIIESFDTDGNHILTSDETGDVWWGICLNACRNIKGIEKVPGLQRLIIENAEATESLDVIDVSEMPGLKELCFWGSGHIKFLNVGNNPNLVISVERGEGYNTDTLTTTSTMVVPSDSFEIQKLVPGVIKENITCTTEGVTYSKETGVFSGYDDGTELTYSYNCGNASGRSITLHGNIKLTVANNYTSIPIDEKHFKDATFRHYIETSIDIDGNKELSPTEMAMVRNIDLRLYQQIASLDGIGYFTELTRLYCGGLSNLASINLAQNKKLKELNCDNTGITNLTISNLEYLETLSCKNTRIKHLAFPSPCVLQNLDCSNTGVSALNVSGLKELENLACSDTNIKELDLQSNMMLERLICVNSPLEILKLPNNGTLNIFDVSSTNLKGMNLNRSTQGADFSELYMSTNLAWLDTGNSSNLTIHAGEVGTDSGEYNQVTGKEATIDCTRDVVVSGEAEPIQAKAKVRAAADTLSLNLETEFPGIDVTKISDVEGADLTGNCFVNIDSATPVKYTYKCGKYKGGNVNLRVILNVSEKQETPPYIPPYIPPTTPDKEPVIEVGNGGAADFDGRTGVITVTPDEGYVVKDVILNGESLGAVDRIENVKITDKVEIVFETVAERDGRIIACVKNTRMTARSEAGKGYIRVKWSKNSGCKMDYYEVYKATSKTKLKESKKPYFKTKNGNWKSYRNSKGLKKGVRYFYRVRGVKEIGGVKYYTRFSTMAYRYAK